VGSDKIVYGLGPLYAVTGSGTTTFARDGGKSVRAELNGSGAVTASFRYLAYGAIAQSSGASTPTYIGYAGQLLDPSGLYYMRARWYDAGPGRFLSRDLATAGMESTMTSFAFTFSYADANPVRRLDPTGWRSADIERDPVFTGSGDPEGICVTKGCTGGSPGGSGTGGGASSGRGSVIDQFFRRLRTSTARDLGRWAEEGIQGAGNRQPIPSYSGTAAFRRPDILDADARVLGEIKNTNYQALTQQIRDDVLYAQDAGYRVVLYVRETTRLSAPLQRAIQDGSIELRLLGW
jgi:RHS repeat-associated protein